MNNKTNKWIKKLAALAYRFLAAVVFAAAWLPVAMADEFDLFPEQDEILALTAGEKPSGVLFVVMEHDEEALQWILPRINRYTRLLNDRWPDLSLAVLSHGEEMMGLLSEFKPLYPEMHRTLQRLVHEFDLMFHVCGSYAAMADVDESEFPVYVDVVPFGPAEIENYRSLDYEVISLESTW